MFKVLLFVWLAFLASCDVSPTASEATLLDEAEYHGKFNFGEDLTVKASAYFQERPENKRHEVFLLTIPFSDGQYVLKGQFSNGVMVSSEFCRAPEQDVLDDCLALKDFQNPRWQPQGEMVLRQAYARIAPVFRHRFEKRKESAPQPSRGPTTVATLFF